MLGQMGGSWNTLVNKTNCTIMVRNFEQCGKFAFSHSEATTFFLSIQGNLAVIWKKNKNKAKTPDKNQDLVQGDELHPWNYTGRPRRVERFCCCLICDCCVLIVRISSKREGIPDLFEPGIWNKKSSIHILLYDYLVRIKSLPLNYFP